MGLIVRVQARHTAVDYNAAEAWAVDGDRTSSDGVSSCCSRRHTSDLRVEHIGIASKLCFQHCGTGKICFQYIGIASNDALITLVLPSMILSTHWYWQQ